MCGGVRRHKGQRGKEERPQVVRNQANSHIKILYFEIFVFVTTSKLILLLIADFFKIGNILSLCVAIVMNRIYNILEIKY